MITKTFFLHAFTSQTLHRHTRSPLSMMGDFDVGAAMELTYPYGFSGAVCR